MATTPKISAATLSFASTYKYKIAGKTDLLFSTVGGLFGQDALKLRLFKSSRLNDVTTQNKIANNPDLTQDQKNIASAEAKANFLNTATRTLKQNLTAKSNPRTIANAINQIAKELQTAVNNYIAGRGGTSAAISGGEDDGVTVDISGEAAGAAGGFDAEQDQAFINNVNNMLRSMKSLLLKQKGPLRMMGKYFDTNYYQADRRLDEITASIANFTSGTPPVSGDESTGDIGTPDTDSTDTPPTGGTGEGEETTPPQQSLDITV